MKTIKNSFWFIVCDKNCILQINQISTIFNLIIYINSKRSLWLLQIWKLALESHHSAVLNPQTFILIVSKQSCNDTSTKIVKTRRHPPTRLFKPIIHFHSLINLTAACYSYICWCVCNRHNTLLIHQEPFLNKPSELADQTDRKHTTDMLS